MLLRPPAKALDIAAVDSGIIGAALRTDHYEIAGYQAAIAMAEALQMDEAVELLTLTLEEEGSAAEKIRMAAKPILAESAEELESR